MKQPLLSLRDAAKRGITRLRSPKWAHPMDHIKIDIIDKDLGPWVHLYAPFNQECNKRDPVSLFVFHVNADDAAYLPYDGPLPDSPEYRQACQKYAGVLERE